MNDNLEISVVIPTYRRRESARRVLDALARQTLSPSAYEVVVVIDGSEDGTLELVAAYKASYALKAIWQTNRGRAGACNAGILAARGELLVLLDDDMDPTPGFLAAHLRAHSADIGLGVMGAAPVTLSPSAPPVVEYVGIKFNRHLEKLARPGYSIGFRDFYSGNFSIRREVLLKVGAFDEDFRVYGNEDGELALRLLKAGVRLVYSPEALALQHYEKDFAALARDNIAKGRTAVLCLRKYPDTFHSLKLSQYQWGSRKWRLLRELLLELSGVLAQTPDWISRLMMRLEKRQPARLHDYYSLALDYFFWVGARSALSERPGADLKLTARPEPLVLGDDGGRTL